VQNVFKGFVVCFNLPYLCRPIPFVDGVKSVTEAESERAKAILLNGAPVTWGFEDLHDAVATQAFTAYAIMTMPAEEKTRTGNSVGHALVGIVFDATSELHNDRAFGVTFGAYPKGDALDGTCLQRSSDDCGENTIEVYMTDEISACAREMFPRRMIFKAQVEGDKIRDQMLATLQKVINKEPV
jgi:hypothetical protein